MTEVVAAAAPVPAVRGRVRARLDHLRRHALAAPAAVAAGAMSAAVLVGTVSPYHPGIYPTCPFLALTGWYCPGCGSLRALHDLVHLDLGGALGMNPLAPVAVAFLLWRWATWTWRAATGRQRTWLAPPGVLWAVLAVVVAFAVARNIPAFAPWLAPGS